MTALLSESEDPAVGRDRQQRIADRFHALNQPLTTLCCSLELALSQPRTAEQYRDNLRDALTYAEQVAGLARGLREMLEAENADSVLNWEASASKKNS